MFHRVGSGICTFLRSVFAKAVAPYTTSLAHHVHQLVSDALAPLLARQIHQPRCFPRVATCTVCRPHHGGRGSIRPWPAPRGRSGIDPAGAEQPLGSCPSHGAPSEPHAPPQAGAARTAAEVQAGNSHAVHDLPRAAAAVTDILVEHGVRKLLADALLVRRERGQRGRASLA